MFALTQAMQRFDFLTEQIEMCETQIAAQIDSLTPPDDGPDGDQPPGSPDASRSGSSRSKAFLSTNARRPAKEMATAQALHKMMGVDLTAIPTIGVNTALTIAAEIGPDFWAFPSAQHFSSWLGLAPGTRINGGKPLPGRAPKAVNKLDAAAGLEPGAVDDLGALGAKLLHRLQAGGGALRPALALRRRRRALGGRGANVAGRERLEPLDDIAVVGKAAAEEVGEEGRRRVAGNRDSRAHDAASVVPVRESGGRTPSPGHPAPGQTLPLAGEGRRGGAHRGGARQRGGRESMAERAIDPPGRYE